MSKITGYRTIGVDESSHPLKAKTVKVVTRDDDPLSSGAKAGVKATVCSMSMLSNTDNVFKNHV